jgi:hypothetical protein
MKTYIIETNEENIEKIYKLESDLVEQGFEIWVHLHPNGNVSWTTNSKFGKLKSAIVQNGLKIVEDPRL